MFYIKTKLTEEIELKVPLYGDEFYTACTGCEKEIQVDERFIAELINEGGDLAGTSIKCAKCTEGE